MEKASHFMLFTLLLLLPIIGNGQVKRFENTALRLDGHFGYLIPEYQLFNQLAEKPIGSVELSFQKQTSGKRFAEQLYNYPAYGLTFLYTSLGNREAFGHEAALYGYFMTHIIRKKWFQLNSQFGLGLGYATKTFNLEDNYMNVAVGSRLNIHFNYKMGTTFRITENLSLNSGVSFSHFSNANMAEPNLGVNTLTAYAGINRSIGQSTDFVKTERPKHIGSNEFAFIYAAGGKHARALQSTIYFTSSLSVEYKRHISHKFRLGGGLDLFYDSSTKTELSTPGNKAFKSSYDFRTGIHLAQELAYGPFSFILQEGVYVGLTNHVDGKVYYNRAIVRYRWNDHFLIHISMKSHLHILDYPEVGFGYWFKKS